MFRGFNGIVAVIALGVATPLLAPLLAAPAPGGGTISIEPETPAEPGDRAAPVFAAAIGAALAEKGFTILQDPGHSAYVADLSVSRTDVGTGSAKVATRGGSVTPGASRGVGAGLSVPLPSGRERTVALQRIQLQLTIRRRGAPAVLWQGVAITVRAAGTEQGSSEQVAASLGEAVLRGYPNPPQGIVTVP
jgi:hypothetical protein